AAAWGCQLACVSESPPAIRRASWSDFSKSSRMVFRSGVSSGELACPEAIQSSLPDASLPFGRAQVGNWEKLPCGLQLALFYRRLLLDTEKLPQSGTQAVEIDVVNRGDEQRERLRKDQATDHGQSERTPRFGAGAKADGDRQGAHERSHRGHHDG